MKKIKILYILPVISVLLSGIGSNPAFAGITRECRKEQISYSSHKNDNSAGETRGKKLLRFLTNNLLAFWINFTDSKDKSDGDVENRNDTSDSSNWYNSGNRRHHLKVAAGRYLDETALRRIPEEPLWLQDMQIPEEPLWLPDIFGMPFWLPDIFDIFHPQNGNYQNR